MNSAVAVPAAPIANATALGAILLLNLLDALFTVGWVRGGMATEANPLMAPLLANPSLFILTKVLMVTSGVLLLARYQQKRLARWGIRTTLFAYAAVVLFHIGFVVNHAWAHIHPAFS